MRITPPWRYAAPAAVLAVAVVLEAVAGGMGAGSVVTVGLAAGALAWVRVHPVAVAAVVLAGYAAVPDATEPVLSLLPYLVALAFVGRFASRRAGAAVVVAAGLALGLRDLDSAKSLTHLVGNLAYFTLFSAVLVVGGQLLAYGERRERELAAMARDLDAEAADRERLAVERERGSIARELHDVVAQALTIIGVHSTVARNALEHDPERVARSLALIDTAAETASHDMRRLLGLLRERPDQTSPVPSLASLPDLVAAAQAAGHHVDLDVDLRLPLPAALEITAYRIVQEALSNVRRHAPGAAVRVQVRAMRGVLTLEVVDSPAAGGEAPRRGGSGTGLVGMRERAAIYGGSLEAGPTPEGGFRLQADFPLDPPADTAS